MWRLVKPNDAFGTCCAHLQFISRVMRNQNKVLCFIACALLPIDSSAQELPVARTSVSDGQVMGERDRDKEDQVAKLFETIRSDSKSPKSSRIGHRDSLEQQVCTIALTGTLPKHSAMDTFAVYKASRPESITPELNHVALFDILHPKNKAGYHRYSVAVWRTKDSKTGETAYWVGVELYWSAAVEFFDYHFTDDISYHNLWKKSVAPKCRGK
jgi:hypothetical protein